MIAYFPLAYPDELFFSRCARYAEWAAYPSLTAVVRDLFGKDCRTVAIDFPRHLNAFIAALPPGYEETAEELIVQETLLPFFAPFLPAPRVRALRELMLTSSCRVSSSALLGWLMRRSSAPPSLRLCKGCVTEDRAHYGEAYWHRIHQLPGVVWCPTHQEVLYRSNVPCWDRLISAEQASKDQLVEAEPVHSRDRGHLLQFANDAAWVLGNGALACDPSGIQSRYVWLLADRRLGSYTGRIREEKLLESIGRFYPATVLARFRCGVLRPQGPSPFLRLVRPFRHAQHPIYHLLLIQFLGLEASVFWNLPARPTPFGAGPWPCLNPAAHHFHQEVVKICQITSSPADGRPLGTFGCRCGFRYQRLGPDLGPLYRYTARRSVKQGHLQTHKPPPLTRHDHSSLQERDAALHIYPRTISATLGSLNSSSQLAFHEVVPAQEDTTLGEETLIARRDWMKVLQLSVQPSQRAAKQLAPRLYRWLHQHDRLWLHQHRPAYRQRIARRPPIDWKSRDEIIWRTIGQAAELLLIRPGRPIRLKPDTLMREARLLAQVPIHRAKLPRSVRRLTDLSEDMSSFAFRRIRWLRDQFRAKQRVPSQSEFVHRIGLGSQVYEVPRIMMVVTRTLNELADEIFKSACKARSLSDIELKTSCMEPRERLLAAHPTHDWRPIDAGAHLPPV